MEVVPVAVDTSEFDTNRAEHTHWFRKLHHLESAFLVLYSGNIGVKHDPEIIVQAANRLREHERIFFAVVGEGALRKALLTLIETYALDNIKIFPLCERSQLPDMLASADLLLLPQRKEVMDTVVPSKLLTYFATGRTIVASVHAGSEAAHLITEHTAGITVPAEDADALAETILRIYMHPEQGAHFGLRGKALARNYFDRKVVYQRYIALFGQTAAVQEQSVELLDSALQAESQTISPDSKAT